MRISKYEMETYAVFRIIAGFLLLYHGAHKLFYFIPPGNETQPYIRYYADAIQLFGGFLVTVGFWTRWAALVSSLEMAFAWWTVHSTGSILPMETNVESPILYCFIFMFIAITGSGMFSIDHYRKKINNLEAHDES